MTVGRGIESSPARKTKPKGPDPMNVYEFILILSSIIVGLGVAELFGGVVRVLRGELKARALLWYFTLRIG
jgi:hypothetical protein